MMRVLELSASFVSVPKRMMASTNNAASLLLLLLVLFFLSAATAAAAAAGCTEELMSFSACLPYVSYPPNNLTESASEKCCDAFSSSVESESVCLCYLVREPLILGFPLNNTRLGSLSSLCSTSTSFPFLCSSSPESSPSALRQLNSALPTLTQGSSSASLLGAGGGGGGGGGRGGGGGGGRGGGGGGGRGGGGGGGRSRGRGEGGGSSGTTVVPIFSGGAGSHHRSSSHAASTLITISQFLSIQLASIFLTTRLIYS